MQTGFTEDLIAYGVDRVRRLSDWGKVLLAVVFGPVVAALAFGWVLIVMDTFLDVMAAIL